MIGVGLAVDDEWSQEITRIPQQIAARQDGISVRPSVDGRHEADRRGQQDETVGATAAVQDQALDPREIDVASP